MFGITSLLMKNEKIKTAKRSRYYIASNVMSTSNWIWSIATIVKCALPTTIITASFSANALVEATSIASVAPSECSSSIS